MPAAYDEFAQNKFDVSYHRSYSSDSVQSGVLTAVKMLHQGVMGTCQLLVQCLQGRPQKLLIS